MAGRRSLKYIKYSLDKLTDKNMPLPKPTPTEDKKAVLKTNLLDKLLQENDDIEDLTFRELSEEEKIEEVKFLRKFRKLFL